MITIVAVINIGSLHRPGHSVRFIAIGDENPIEDDHINPGPRVMGRLRYKTEALKSRSGVP